MIQYKVKIFIDCVLPGVLLVLANFLLELKELRILDFPEFDLPQIAISIPLSSGRSLYENPLIKKNELKKIFLDLINYFD